MGGGGPEMRREQLPPLSHLDGGEGGRGGGGLATVCTPHVCSPLSRSSFSFLHPAVKASFDIKKACGKPYRRKKIIHGVGAAHMHHKQRILICICMLVIYVNSRLSHRSGGEGRELLPTPGWRQFPALLSAPVVAPRVLSHQDIYSGFSTALICDAERNNISRACRSPFLYVLIIL